MGRSFLGRSLLPGLGAKSIHRMNALDFFPVPTCRTQSPSPAPGQAGPGPPLSEVPAADKPRFGSWGGKWTAGPGSLRWEQRSKHLVLLTLKRCQDHSRWPWGPVLMCQPIDF